MAQFNLTDQTNLFKTNYYKKSDNLYNSENVLAGRIKKRYDFTGKERFVSNPLGFSGGVGSGVLPQSNAGQYEGSIIQSKKVYATCEVEREAIKASANNAGAFVQATKETVQKCVESYMRNGSRILFGDGSAILGRGDGATNVSGAGTTGAPYVITIADDTTLGDGAGFVEAHFEEKDFVQVVTGMNAGDNLAGADEGGTTKVNLLEIVQVDVINKQMYLVGTSAVLTALTGVGPLLTTSGICMQSSYLKDPVGLRGTVEVAAGSLYNIPIQRRWSGLVNDAALKGVTVDRMNSAMLQIDKKSGKTPNLIMASYEQFQNILALLEDQKVYNLPNKNLKGALSFDGLEFMSIKGRIGIFVDRFCPKDRIYFLNDNYMECHNRPDHGWFDDDGTVFLRKADDDAYSARYGGYYQNYIMPTFHGVIKNLAV